VIYYCLSLLLPELDQLLLNCISITKYKLLFWKVIQILFSITLAMEGKIQNKFVESNLNTNYFQSTCYTSKTGWISCWVRKIKLITNTLQNCKIETPSDLSVLSKHVTCESLHRHHLGTKCALEFISNNVWKNYLIVCFVCWIDNSSKTEQPLHRSWWWKECIVSHE